MQTEDFRAIQAPLKERYRNDPAAALVTLRVEAILDPETLTARVSSRPAGAAAGLHPAAGGDGTALCTGDMLLEALAACAGVTLLAVSTASGIPIKSGRVIAYGDLDFRGTLGLTRDVPVGFSLIRLGFDINANATLEQIGKLLQTTERYCVVAQTIRRETKLELELTMTTDEPVPVE